jgi:monoamine oxidase
MRSSPVAEITSSGMGDFIQRTLGAGVPVTVSTPVTEINRVANGVELVTPNGTVRAARCVLTVPMGVLAPRGAFAESKIKFHPDLPADYRAAIEALPMGHDEKIALGFNGPVFSEDFIANLNTTVFPFDVNRPQSTFTVAPFWRRDFCVCVVGASLARDLAGRGSQALIQYALDSLRAMFGRDFSGQLRDAVASNWTTDPWSLGSYTWAVPGHASARLVLNVPVDDRLFFAGEAVPVGFHSSVLGAYLTGFQAAIEILAQTPSP